VVLYIGKWLAAPEAAKAELEHPVQCCFIGLVGVATMLVAGAILPHARGVAVLLAAAGMIFTLGFAVWITGRLWQGGRDPGTTTAVLYLPTGAGGFVAGTTLAALGLSEWGQLAFGMGFFAALAIESVLLHRLLTAPAMPPALRPTIGIQLAPPAVGAVCYLGVSGPGFSGLGFGGPGIGGAAPDLFAHMLIGYGMLQALLMLRLLPWIAEGGFSPGFWAFSFGTTALANAALILVTRGESGPMTFLAPGLFVGANLVVAVLAVDTLWRLAQGRLVPPPA
jgi:tellurite resistance protein